MTETQKEFINKNYKKLTNKEISDILNISQTSIIRYLNKNGLSRRKTFILQENEVLKDIPNYSKYQITNFGRICKKENNTEILPSFTPDGYLNIKLLNDDNKRNTIRLNRLVAKVFIENNDPAKIEVNHKDGNKTNNRVDNLEWVTPSENQKHAYKNDLRKPITREQCEFTKYTENQVRELCILLEKNPKESSTEIMKKLSYKTSSGFINKIKNKERWKDIVKDYNF